MEVRLVSLLVWLPLVSNLENQGASLVQATGVNITTDTNGKVGSCYSFNGSNGYIKLDSSVFSNSTTEFSYTCWFKPAATTSGCLFSCRTGINNTGISIFINNSGTILFDIGNERLTCSQSLSAGTWYHLAFTYKKNGKKTIYLNGAAISSIDSSSTMTTVSTTNMFIGASQNTDTTVSANYLNGLLNDVHIYNHCLSPAEVHEISQGLILHYKLSANNLINKHTLTENCYINASGTTTGSTGWYASDYIPIYQGKTYQTIDLSKGGSGTRVALYDANKIYKRNLILVANENLTITPNEDEAYIRLSIRNLADELRKAQFVEVQEILTDLSGYNYHGILTGNLNLNSNTARYSSSTYISSGDTNYITTPTLQLPGDQITINFWFNSTNTSPGSNYHMPFEAKANTNTAYEMSIYKTGYLRGGLVVAGSRKVDNCTSTKLLDGNWHMCSMTYDGAIIKRYVDGVMEKSTTVSGALVTSTEFVIGHYGANTSYYTKEAYISDIRLYATALSETDIQSLYTLGAKIDNNYNLHSYEAVESSTNKITKQGQLRGADIHEIPDIFIYDPIIYVEPDGSQWAHIFHHNNPASYKFASGNKFTAFVYIDTNRWFNFAACDLLPTYEFFAEVKRTSDDELVKYRWIQPSSPMTATFNNTKTANITRITTTGYTLCPFGGLYHVSANTWLAMNNGTNNNWYGAVGCWQAWNGGITGWASNAASNAITTGSVDIYVRVDNIDFSQINLTTKSIKTDKWKANTFIEF